MADTTSQSLLQRAALARDPDAWQRLAALYTPLLRKWIGRCTLQSHDADDVVQEVLSVVHRKLPDFRHNERAGAFRSWLRQILAFELRHFQRGHRAGRGGLPCLDPADLDRLDDPESDLSRQWDREFDQHVLDQALAAVRPEFQPSSWEAFRLTVLEARPTAEVAAALGMTDNAVRLARMRVLRRLREQTAALQEW
jgi:RNA polymerase sigma-70 factor (ECF subfamily)